MMGVHIRPARNEDAEDFAEIRRQPSVGMQTAGLPSSTVEASRRFLENRNERDHILVAEVDGKVVGTAGLQVFPNPKQRFTASLGMFVHEDYQGQGIGKMLMEAIIDLADNWLGLVRVELDVFPDNERAIALYRQFGFVEEGIKRKTYFRKGRFDDIVVMGRVREVF